MHACWPRPCAPSYAVGPRAFALPALPALPVPPPPPPVRPAHPLARWRICPASGQRVLHWDHADPLDPQRPLVSSLAQASLMLDLYLSTRAA
ncbi:hypothetical protein [Pseudomonas sp. FP833]|uniref:hypothetical protein n=1 Tax=Pseudomonas sp. FP833 TaxID=2954102 RepID=UPI002732E81D|nr:hypothetical protein [Pseudomonas sp. FP833]WLI48466.1 hypothetical protein PSH63_18420 [Pseudomonas sp. FP833]